MEPYDPRRGPDSKEWLNADEAELIEAVIEQHRKEEEGFPGLRLHAVVGKQLSAGEKDTGDALSKLEREGLDRHRAIHAIGTVLADYLHELLSSEGRAGPGKSPNDHRRKLRNLTARDRLNMGRE